MGLASIFTLFERIERTKIVVLLIKWLDCNVREYTTPPRYKQLLKHLLHLLHEAEVSIEKSDKEVQWAD